MQLPSPVTVQIPSFTRKTGEVRSYPPRVVSELGVTLIDDAARKVVEARLGGFPRGIVLWRGEAYDAAGDYTQAQAEARLLENLGPDLKAGLEALFPAPAPTQT